MVYNLTTQKLKTPRRCNPPEERVRSPGALDGIIRPEQFVRAQEILKRGQRKYDSEYGLTRSSLLPL